MKNMHSFLAIILFTCLVTLPGCQPVDVVLPDLNPGTAEGGDILIFNIFDLIEYTSDVDNNIGVLGGINREYDFQGDGSIDLRVVGSFESFFGSVTRSILSLKFVGSILKEYEAIPAIPFIPTPGYAIFMPVDGLTGIELTTGGWASSWERVDINVVGNSEWIGGDSFMAAYYPAGISYVPTKTRIGGEDYYGWLEVISSDHDDADPNEQLIISRFGISQTPGLRIRMGQS